MLATPMMGANAMFVAISKDLREAQGMDVTMSEQQFEIDLKEF